MKKIIITLALTLACIQAFGQLVITQKKDEPIEKQRSSSVAYLDFRPFTSNGFFLSTGDYHGVYTPVCSMEIKVEPETVKNTGKRKVSDPIYFVTEIKDQEILSEAVDFAREMGANGIVNLTFSVVEYGAGADIMVSPPIKHYIVTGLCISIPQPED